MSRRARAISPEILYVDEHLIALDKPAGYCVSVGRGDAPGVVDWLSGRPGLDLDASPLEVHRLDQGASGVAVYGRTRLAQEQVLAQLADGRAEVVYGALVAGYVEGDGEIDLPLHFDRRSHRMEAAAGRGAPALTRYRIVQRVGGGTWLEVRPVGERMHQVRAHLTAIGHPLSVDPLYGGGQAILLSHHKPRYHPNRREEERPLIERLTLHALRVTLRHPASGDVLMIEAPLPRDLRATLQQLGRLG